MPKAGGDARAPLGSGCGGVSSRRPTSLVDGLELGLAGMLALPA